MPLYFAYGSNMDVAAMAERCPRSSRESTARLPRHRFALTPRGFATIVRDDRAEVHGVLWSLALADMPALDRWEEVSSGLYTKVQQSVLRTGGSPVRALVYIGCTPEPPGPSASRDYFAAVLRAGRDAGLPEAYLAAMVNRRRPPAEPPRGNAGDE
jgi:gamma-glutamylcyclotransferase (GGCT)/AIG2-like uncharacterized protein YtfP